MRPSSPSGKFVLRLNADSHARLKRRAERSGQSLNQLCADLLEAGVSRSRIDAGDLARSVLEKIAKPGLPQLQGLVLFGSVARGDATASSDLDLLLVLDSSVPLNRDLYRLWDRAVAQHPLNNDREVSPQFTHLPGSVADAGSLWLECAIDGIVLWEKDLRVSRILSKLREEIASGTIVRKVSHGHPYWIRSVEGGRVA